MHDGIGYAVVECVSMYRGQPSYRTNSISWQVVVPTNVTEHVYVRYRDVTGEYVDGRYATNAVTSAQVAPLWRRMNAEIDFAYRTFKWRNEAKDNAAVHCVITGFHAKSVATAPSPSRVGRGLAGHDGEGAVVTHKVIYDADLRCAADVFWQHAAHQATGWPVVRLGCAVFREELQLPVVAFLLVLDADAGTGVEADELLGGGDGFRGAHMAWVRVTAAQKERMTAHLFDLYAEAMK